VLGELVEQAALGVSAPVPAPASRHRVRARLVISWTWDDGRTRLHRVRITGLPRRGRLALGARRRAVPMARLL
jgi:hypothetical protein